MDSGHLFFICMHLIIAYSHASFSFTSVGLTNEVRWQTRFSGRFDYDHIIFSEVIILSVACLLIKNFIATETSQNGGSAHAAQNGGQGASTIMNVLPISAASAPGVIPGPTTNLNIGMDYWGAPAASSVPAIRGKVPSTPVAGGLVTAGSRDGVQSQHWLQVNFSL